MNNKVSFAAAAVIFLSACATAPAQEAALAQDIAEEEQTAEAFLLPSFAAGALWQGVIDDTEGRSRSEVAEPYLKAVKRDDLPKDERFALGHLLYNSFQADPVVEIMKDYMDDENDWVARHALLTLHQTTFVVYDDYETASEYYAKFIDRFSVSSPHDNRGLDAATRNLAWLHNENGDSDKAIKVMEEEIRRIGFKLPYYSFYLPLQHSEIFKAAGRTNDAIKLMAFAKAGLEKELAMRLERGPIAKEEAGPMMPLAMRRWYPVWQGIGRDASVFEGRNRQFREMIERLERGIKAAEDSIEY